MRVEIDTVGEVGKGFTTKLEKQPDDTLAVIAHLKLAAVLVSRETIDELCSEPIGWTQMSFFDELGAPRQRRRLELPDLRLSFTGTINGGGDEKLVLTEATVTGVRLEFVKGGANLSGELAWPVAGDEAGDCEPLQGRTCGIVGALYDGGQEDLLRSEARAA